MYKSYFKIGWRNLLRDKSHSLINISGLAIGMGVAILIGLWVADELSFNKSYKHYNRICNVYHSLTFGDDTFTDSGVPTAMSNALRNNFPEFENVALTTYRADHLIDYNEATYSKPGLFVEPSFAEIFSLRMVHGTANTLKNMQSILLSKTLADAILGDNPIGKMVKLDNQGSLLVTGVYEDFPVNSEFSEIQMLIPMDYYFTTSASARKQRDSWEDISFQCFVLLNDKTTLQDAELSLIHI